MAFLLFREIEINLRDKLTKLLQPSTTVQLDRKEELLTSAIQDDNIQFYWTMLSADIDGEQESVELLRDIVELWLTYYTWIFNCWSMDGDLQEMFI